MQIGDKSAPDAKILELGFVFSTQVTILGTVIVNDTCNQEENAKAIQEKVRKQVRYWSRFSLSLPGRIHIAKTMMYSQVNYLGCFLPFSRNQITPIEHLIEHYVRGNLKISTDRILTEVQYGGLGLFRVESFLNAQKCSWIRRAQNIDELWKEKLSRAASGNLLCLRSSFLDVSTKPILKNLAVSWEKFYFKFTARNENFKLAYVFDNPVFKLNRRTNAWVTKRFFGDDFYGTYGVQIKKLKFLEIQRGDHDIPFLPHQSLMLRGMVETALADLSKDNLEQQKQVDISVFMNKSTKGSRRFR